MVQLQSSLPCSYFVIPTVKGKALFRLTFCRGRRRKETPKWGCFQNTVSGTFGKSQTHISFVERDTLCRSPAKIWPHNRPTESSSGLPLPRIYTLPSSHHARCRSVTPLRRVDGPAVRLGRSNVDASFSAAVAPLRLLFLVPRITENHYANRFAHPFYPRYRSLLRCFLGFSRTTREVNLNL